MIFFQKVEGEIFREIVPIQRLQAQEEFRVILCQKFPAPPFVRFDACNFQNENGKIFYLTAGMLSQDLQASDILF